MIRFSVNFIEKKTQHRIFHMDFRFCCPWPHETVRNMNYPQGCWGPEERSDNPIQKGSYFKVEVKILSDRYVVCPTLFYDQNPSKFTMTFVYNAGLCE